MTNTYLNNKHIKIMNNFLVSQKENKRYGVWLWVIVLAALVVSVWPVTVPPITG